MLTLQHTYPPISIHAHILWFLSYNYGVSLAQPTHHYALDCNPSHILRNTVPERASIFLLI